MRESLQRDCNRLQREVDVLKEEIKDSKVTVIAVIIQVLAKWIMWVYYPIQPRFDFI